MRVLLFPFCLFACEQVPSSGNPLEPVSVTPTTAKDEGAADAPEPATEAQSAEVFTLSSEEMAPAANESVPESGEPQSEAEGEPQRDAAGTRPVTETPSATDSSDPPAPTPVTGSVASGWPRQASKAWPVRLVTTVPNATPPRAILGLPDGREVVVNPGSMVPELGIVVVAISPNSADLAKVAPAGDHATIESVTLTAQY